MIKYTLKVGGEVATLECETMDELLQYLKADKSEVVNVEEMTNNESVNNESVNNESVNKAIDSLNSYAKAWNEREALTKINSVTNNID